MADHWPILIFSTTILSQALAVEILPSGTVVSAPGHDLTFQCLLSSGSESFTDVEWLLNGSWIEDHNLTNIKTTFFPNAGLGLLRFASLTTALNSSRIRCKVYLASGSGPLLSSATLLLLQGRLSSVTDIRLHNNVSDTVIISWRALDVMEASDDDLTYCIGVTNNTESLHMECNITETQFAFSLPPMSWCGVITFTVTPVNLAGRGSPSETVYVPELNPPKIDSVQCTLIEDGNTRIYSYALHMTSLVCNAEVSISLMMHLNSTVARNLITFSSHRLDLDRVYNVHARAENFGGSTSSQTRIRTNDITAVEMRISGSKLEYQVSFCENSEAGGVFVSLLYITEDGNVDFSKSSHQALDRTQSSNYTIVLDYDGEYKMFVYNILRDGTLASGTSSPAVMNTLSVNGTDNVGSTPQPSIQCRAYPSLLLLWVECTSSNGLQVIARSIETADVGTLYTNHSSDPQATVTVQLESTGIYHVSVFPILGERGILDTSAEYRQQVMVGNIVPSQGTTTTDVTTTAKVDNTEPPSSSQDPWIAVGVLVVVLVVVLMVWGVMCIWRRKCCKIGTASPFTRVDYVAMTTSTVQPAPPLLLTNAPHPLKLGPEDAIEREIMSSLPVDVLEVQLDSGPEGNLLEIAECVPHDWINCTLLDLTPKEIHNNIIQKGEKTVMKRKEALKKWVDKQPHRPTCGDLLKLLVSSGSHQKVRKAFVNFVREKKELPDTYIKVDSFHVSALNHLPFQSLLR